MVHPVRAKLLFAVAERSQEGVSIRQISERTGDSPRRVRYHLDALLELGLVGISSRRTRRGVVERFYRAEIPPFLTNEDVDGYDEGKARQLSVQTFKAILRDVSLAVAAKKFGARSGHMIIRFPCELDDQGWKELGSLQEQTMRDSQTIIDRSRDRLKATEGDPITASAALLLFEVPPWPAP
jgi:DNA-binding transcriptional ArsR family regulator